MPNASALSDIRNNGYNVATTDGKVSVKGIKTGYTYLGDWTYLTPEESSDNGRLRHYIDEKNRRTMPTRDEAKLLEDIPKAKGYDKENKIARLQKGLKVKQPITQYYDSVRNKIYDSSIIYDNYVCNQLMEHGVLKDSTGNPVTECPADSNDPNSLTIRTPPSNNNGSNGSSTPRAMGGRKARKTRVRRRVRKTRRR